MYDLKPTDLIPAFKVVTYESDGITVQSINSADLWKMSFLQIR